MASVWVTVGCSSRGEFQQPRDSRCLSSGNKAPSNASSSSNAPIAPPLSSLLTPSLHRISSSVLIYRPLSHFLSMSWDLPALFPSLPSMISCLPWNLESMASTPRIFTLFSWEQWLLYSFQP